MLLYDSPVSGNCYKVRLLLAHLGVAYERQTVDVVDRSSRAAVARRAQPGAARPDARARRRPLARRVGRDPLVLRRRHALRPRQIAYARAQVLQWMFFEQYDHEPAIAVARFWLAYSGRPEAFETASRRADGGRLPRARRDGAAPGRARVARRRRHDARRHRALRVHARRGRGRFRARALPGDPAWLERVASQPGHVTIDA